MGILPSKAGDLMKLRALYWAIKRYFEAENAFLRNPCDETWEKKRESDRGLSALMGEIGDYLKGLK